MNPIAIATLLVYFSVQIYFSLRKLKVSDFNCIVHTKHNTDRMAIDSFLNSISGNYEYTVKALDENNILLERKLSFLSFGYSFLFSISGSTTNVYYYERNIPKRLLGLRANQIEYKLEKWALGV